MEKIGYLEESPGAKSSMRAMCFVSLLAAVAFGVLTILTENPDGLYLSAMFLVGAFAPKAVQKYAEIPKIGAPKVG